MFKLKHPLKKILIMCDPGETRTPNLLIRSQMLYPLSYGAISKSLYTQTKLQNYENLPNISIFNF